MSYKASPFLVLLLLPLSQANETVCVEDLGLGPNCYTKPCSSVCEKKYKGGMGECDLWDSCQCFYDCVNPQKKMCHTELGLYMLCTREQCTRDCAQKVPGSLPYCYNDDTYPDQTCRCAHLC